MVFSDAGIARLFYGKARPYRREPPGDIIVNPQFRLIPNTKKGDV